MPLEFLNQLLLADIIYIPRDEIFSSDRDFWIKPSLKIQ